MNSKLHRMGVGALVGLAVAASGCKKAEAPAAPAPKVAEAKAGEPAALPAPATKTGALVAPVQVRRSAQVATNDPAAPCPGCPADGANKPRAEVVPLDSESLAEVRHSIDATCDLLEQGVAILEKNKDKPDAALAALEAFRKKSEPLIARAHDQAKRVRDRLTASGYTQDVPEEVREHYEKRMSKISQRLEPLQQAYAKRTDVLRAFGALFPRPQ